MHGKISAKIQVYDETVSNASMFHHISTSHWAKLNTKHVYINHILTQIIMLQDPQVDRMVVHTLRGT